MSLVVNAIDAWKIVWGRREVNDSVNDRPMLDLRYPSLALLGLVIASLGGFAMNQAVRIDSLERQLKTVSQELDAESDRHGVTASRLEKRTDEVANLRRALSGEVVPARGE